MDDVITRIAENLAARVGGPMKFRLLLQPLMASIFAVLAGLKDAKAGRGPYFWSLLTDPQNRRQLLADGWKGVGKVFLLALVLDVVYQWVVQHRIYPFETLLVAFLLAIVPYLLLRGLTTRLAGKRNG